MIIKNKKGVSLVTVLFFMLVATIAATATFKWLTSENTSSASRLLQDRARQAALGGIESARSWMTNNASETGAVLKQYLSTKTPVTLDQVLHPVIGENEKFSVKVIGVDADPTKSTYKVKIVSTGEVTGQASHSEYAILRVTGLYRVKLPEIDGSIPYNVSYFGGSLKYSGSHTATAMIINGNWSGNPSNVTKDYIVTGNVTLSGSDISVGGTTCFGGTLNADNGVVMSDLFVAGNVTKFNGHVNNAYFDNSITLGTTGGNFSVNGNMTLNGTMNTQLDAYAHSVTGNVCLGKNGQLKLNAQNYNNGFEIGGNMWVPSTNGLAGQNKDDPGTYGKFKFGKTSNAKLYIKDGYTCTQKYTKEPSGKWIVGNSGTNCATDPRESHQSHSGGDQTRFTTAGTVIKDFTDKDKNFNCAENVKDYCDNIWKYTPNSGCDNSNYTVKDILQTSYSKFVKFANVASCANTVDRFNKDNINKLNSCYAKLSGEGNESELFNGFLVTKLESDFNASNEASAKLNGKFIFIYEETLGKIKLPGTTPNSVVFLYLRNGGNEQIQCADTDKMNYFIFTDKSIVGQNAGFDGNCNYSGSIYALQKNCAKVGELNGSVSLEFNPAVLEALTEAKVLCSADVTNCGGSGAPSGSGLYVEDAFAQGYDTDFVPFGTQLIVEVESQYKNNETTPTGQAIEPSISVFPRIVYLHRDAVGQLSDYYKVQRLNKAPSSGTGSVTCTDVDAPATSGTLRTGGNLLSEGLFTCQYSETIAAKTFTSIFHVYVSGLSSDTPPVSFDGDDVMLSNQQQHTETVSLKVKAVSGTAQPFTINIVVSSSNEESSGWKLDDQINNKLEKHVKDGTTYYTYSGVTSTAPQIIQIFKVTTDKNAAAGTTQFMLQSPEGCSIDIPATKSISIQGKTNVIRRELSDYCPKHMSSDVCKKEYSDRPVCKVESEKTWVYAKGSTSACTVTNATKPNDEWQCAIDPEVKLMPGSDIPDYCELVVPEEAATVAATESFADYELFGSMLGKKYTLDVYAKNVKHGGKIKVCKGEVAQTGAPIMPGIPWSPTPAQPKEDCEVCSKDHCSYDVYGSETYTLIAEENGGDKFNYWHCEGLSCSFETQTSTEYTLAIVGSASVTATFNESDDHCFYEDFKSGLDIFCPKGETHCIEECKESRGNCSVNSTDAEWMIAYNNASSTPGVKKPEPVGGSANENPKPVVSEGYLSFPDHSGFGTQTIILKNTVAGPDGVMNALFQTMISDDSRSNGHDASNFTGFILRSDEIASRFMTLQIYGSGAGFEGTLSARICYETSATLNSPKDIQCTYPVEFKTVYGTSVSITSQTMVKAIIKISKNDLDITATTNEVESTVHFDLSAAPYSTLSSIDQKYVGFALNSPSTKLYDIGWRSESFDDATCFDYPSIQCSFKANYLGGIVPKDQDTYPWFSVSSWFTKNGCTFTYYYNGCDNKNQETYNCSKTSSDGNTDRNGINTPSYHFVEEGPHGTPFKQYNGISMINGTRWDAKIHVEKCGEIKSNYLDQATSLELYESCGQFNVGEKKSCSDNETLLKSEVSSTNGNAIEIKLDRETNLRDADLVFSIDGASDDQAISVVLKDKSGNSSVAGYIFGVGIKYLNVNNIANANGFDPQRVTAITVKSNASFKIESLMSSCPYATNLNCRTISYKNGLWRLSAEIQNAISCQVIPGTTSSAKPQTFKPCTSGEFTLDEDLSDLLVETEFQFTIVATTANGSKSCDLSKTISPESSSSSSSTSGLSLSCPKTLSGPSVTFIPTVSGCNAGDCSWSISDSPTISPATGYSGGSVKIDNAMAGVTYTLTLTREDGESKTCDIEIENSEVNTDLVCKLPNKILAGTSNQEIEVTAKTDLQVDVYIDNKKINTENLRANKTMGIGNFKAPEESGTHTFRITRHNEDIPLCDGSFETINPLTCSIENDPPKINERNTFNVSVEDGFTCKSCTFTGVDCPPGKCNGAAASSMPFTPKTSSTVLSVECSCDNNTKFKCTQEASVKVEAPNVICPSVPYETTPKGAVSFSPADISGCESGCEYEIKRYGNNKANASGKNYTGGPVQFNSDNGKDEDLYTFEVKNTQGTANCQFNVKYKKDYCSPDVPVQEHLCNKDGNNNGNINGFDTTGPICIKIKGTFQGWGQSNFEGRKWRINGGPWNSPTESPSTADDGYIYIDISSGALTYAGIYWYGCK